jgi:hypothetical protein
MKVKVNSGAEVESRMGLPGFVTVADKRLYDDAT